MNMACAKELWDYLEITYEGTSQVKKSKINVFVKNSEIFSMRRNNAIDVFCNKLKGITNELQALEKE